MRKPKDLTGLVFGKLTVISYVKDATQKRESKWMCLCECGNTHSVRSGSLRSGGTTSCGCIRPITYHGQSGAPEYVVWHSMIQRCTNINQQNYAHYGGRGITVCDRWLKFENFIEDMGQRPCDNFSIDRTNNDLGYFKENCAWVDKKTQSGNRRTNKYYSLSGKTMLLIDWSKELSISYDVLYARIRSGWTVEKTLTTPLIRTKS